MDKREFEIIAQEAGPVLRSTALLLSLVTLFGGTQFHRLNIAAGLVPLANRILLDEDKVGFTGMTIKMLKFRVLVLSSNANGSVKVGSWLKVCSRS
jgi:hypothetical protein